MKSDFYKQVADVAVPQALQSLVQNSFGVIDQVMIGQLGVTAIAAVGFASKYVSIFTTVLTAASAGLGIFAAQYAGRNERTKTASLTGRMILVSVSICLTICILSMIFPVMKLYTEDAAFQASSYLWIAIWSLPFTAINLFLSVVLRCYGHAKEPFYASAVGIILNTVLNALFIFGFGWQLFGAALATVLTQGVSALIVILYCRRYIPWVYKYERMAVSGLAKVIVPLAMADFLWSLGENVYVMVYGHTTLNASAAMTMTIPVQSLVIGLLSGFAGAAGILVGKDLGQGDKEAALEHSRILMRLSAIGSILLFILLLIAAPFYVRIYSVSDDVRSICIGLLAAFGAMSIVKVQNMVLGGGILRAGGHTGELLAIDMIGTWLAGVPLAFLGLHLFGTNIILIYLLLSQEEVLRCILCLIMYHRRKWMTRLS